MFLPKRANARTISEGTTARDSDHLDLIEETSVDCPYCGENITLVLDLSVTSQNYIEDCFVCCQPMQVRYSAENGELINISVASTDS